MKDATSTSISRLFITGVIPTMDGAFAPDSRRVSAGNPRA